MVSCVNGLLFLLVDLECNKTNVFKPNKTIKVRNFRLCREKGIPSRTASAIFQKGGAQPQTSLTRSISFNSSERLVKATLINVDKNCVIVFVKI